VPEWRKEQGLELGHGEFVCGNRYSFTTQLKAPVCAAARPFVWARSGARSGFKLDIPSGGEILYRFALPDRRFKDAEGTIASVHRNGGRLTVEASADGGAAWTRLASITDATPYKISFPARMFPCAEILLRLRMEGAPKERIHIGMIGFSGHFEGKPVRMAGKTRFVEKATGAVFLEAGSLDYRVDTFGERLPESADGIQLWAQFCEEALQPDSPFVQWINNGPFIRFADELYCLPCELDLSGIKTLRPGLHLGSIRKDRFEPAHALALALSPEDVQCTAETAKQTPLFGESKTACAFLRGESLMTGDCVMNEKASKYRGWCLITAAGYPLGWGKAADERIRNHYPKGLRRFH
jgi:NOL1/NOP2/fmu family ribosome biogenesis protein